MIRTVQIQNFKSVQDLELDLGRVTVLIGANGSGKSNILEAIAFAAAAAVDRLDNEFLAPRGIRSPDNPRHFLSMFGVDNQPSHRDIAANKGSGNVAAYLIHLAVSREQARWFTTKYEIASPSKGNGRIIVNTTPEDDLSTALSRINNANSSDMLSDSERNSNERSEQESGNNIFVKFTTSEDSASLALVRNNRQFLIYAPENRELRTFAEEGQILPLGIRGEGLFRLLKILAQQDDGAKLAILKEKLQLIDWFEDFEFQQDAMAYERRLLIRDRYLSDDLAYFDQRSANEGFLFLLFYFCLFLSDATPPFFAIDNIDSSLNPKLCERLMQELVKMAKENGKQVILTTHNPAILDGLDLNDDEQRLYTVRRNRKGETIAERICAPKVTEGQRPIRLSDAYLRGLLGGLPTNF